VFGIFDGESLDPQDVYRLVVERVIERIEAEWDKESAQFWLDPDEHRLGRKIIKRPAGTFGYHVTAQGMRDQIVEVYAKQHGGNEPPDNAAWYLAHHVMQVCRETFKKPAEVMDEIVIITKYLAERNLPLRWITRAGFPVINGYYEPKLVQVDNQLRGERVRVLVAAGWKPAINADKAKNAAAPNFVHSLDAAHAVGVINAGVRGDHRCDNSRLLCLLSSAASSDRAKGIHHAARARSTCRPPRVCNTRFLESF
jgi:DNA-directed RNA polymerase